MPESIQEGQTRSTEWMSDRMPGWVEGHVDSHGYRQHYVRPVRMDPTSTITWDFKCGLKADGHTYRRFADHLTKVVSKVNAGGSTAKWSGPILKGLTEELPFTRAAIRARYPDSSPRRTLARLHAIGRCQAEATATIMREQGLEASKLVLVGHSEGGLALMNGTSVYSRGDVAAALLVNPVGTPNAAGLPRWRTAAGLVMPGIAAPMHYPGLATGVVRNFVKDPSSIHPTLSCGTSVSPLLGRLRVLEVPTMVIASQRDPVKTVTDERALAERLNASFIIIKDGRHDSMTMYQSRMKAIVEQVAFAVEQGLPGKSFDECSVRAIQQIADDVALDVTPRRGAGRVLERSYTFDLNSAN